MDDGVEDVVESGPRTLSAQDFVPRDELSRLRLERAVWCSLLSEQVPRVVCDRVIWTRDAAQVPLRPGGDATSWLC